MRSLAPTGPPPDPAAQRRRKVLGLVSDAIEYDHALGHTKGTTVNHRDHRLVSRADWVRGLIEDEWDGK